MNKLTNEEISRVFGMYLDCEIFKFYTKLIAVNTEDIEYVILEDEGFNSRILSFTNTSPKLLLTPLSSISDEHAIEVAKVFGGIDHLSDESKIAQVKELICTNQLYTKQTNITGSRWGYVFQHLIKKGYAVPLWFDIDHWANGMTAIEMEIAFDKNKI